MFAYNVKPNLKSPCIMSHFTLKNISSLQRSPGRCIPREEFQWNSAIIHYVTIQLPPAQRSYKFSVVPCVVVWFFFFLLNSAFPPEHFWGRNKRICTNPLYMNQIFMLCPLEALSSSNLWNVISWPQHSGTSKSAALWAVLEPAENFYTFVSQAYENLVGQLWHSLLHKASVQSVPGERGMVWLSHVCGTIQCHQEQAGWWTTQSAHFKLKYHGKLQPQVPPHGPFCPFHTAQFPSASSPASTASKHLQNPKGKGACGMSRHPIPSTWKSHPFLKKNKSFCVVFVAPRNLWRMGLCYK